MNPHTSYCGLPTRLSAVQYSTVVTTGEIEWACDSINSDIVSQLLLLPFFSVYSFLHLHHRRRRRRLFKKQKEKTSGIIKKRGIVSSRLVLFCFVFGRLVP